MKIDREMFEEWMANPVTEHVLARVASMAEANKQRWVDVSWGGGETSPLILAELKARAEAAADLSSIKFEDIEEDGK